MVDIERGSDKKLYLYGHKRVSFEQKNHLPPLKELQNLKRLFTFSNGRKVEANHIIISGNEILENTKVHPINPRNQKALDHNAVRDILEQIRNRGVDKEGIAIQENNKYLIIEGSRRRYCCIETQQDFPLWVINDTLTSKEIYEIINASQSSKKFSYREIGQQYLKQMQEFNFTTNEAFAEYINTSTETVRKRIQAAKINEWLIKIFPDTEGIPNSFYSKLAKIEKELVKNNIDLIKLSKQVKEDVFFDKNINIEDYQNQLMQYLMLTVKKITGTKNEIIWQTYDLITFNNKDKYIKASHSLNGRKTKFEFNRINIDLIKEIENFIIDHLKKYE